MALAKLCACACGGAVIGGGAVHVAESAQNREITKRAITKRAITKRAAPRPAPRRVVTRVVTRTTNVCPPTVVTVASQAAPVPLPPAFAGADMPPMTGGGGFGGGPVLVGGTGGGGIGGGFFACLL